MRHVHARNLTRVIFLNCALRLYACWIHPSINIREHLVIHPRIISSLLPNNSKQMKKRILICMPIHPHPKGYLEKKPFNANQSIKPTNNVIEKEPEPEPEPERPNHTSK
ncbi:hypothetical protein EYC84_001814 [Monilinia fructicola]|uniref:Secreted protein n=1 Tax=Monilinia fructicola TaxID=38448 RepID=A0A5M9JT40_MONFR|nr:hypothetical protein EYC84_001814 [Monilinia fructicola]